jgi:hypothetical protein
MEVIQDIADLLHEPGTFFEFGCNESEIPQFVEISKQKFGRKKYCAVKDWTVWDLNINEDGVRLLANHGVMPSILYAKYVIDDSAGRFSIGNYVMSTPLVELADGCFFITRNTVYILVGDGTRKIVNPDLVSSVYL